MNKERFLSLYREHITREGSNDLLDWLEQSDFFTAPASTRFHGNYPGGLLEHSLNVYDTLLKLVATAEKQDEFSSETLAIVALLHDICKVNFYKLDKRNVKIDGQWTQVDYYTIDERFPCGHGEKSVIILQNFMRLTGDEIMAIRAHMGGWDAAARGGDQLINGIFSCCPLAVLTHIADSWATYLMESKK